ncbi:MAG: PDZ domain-containing protein [Pirellulaceae bacterium]|nr:PDZ domain-containing protein [Pirellulaceae bacterium]
MKRIFKEGTREKGFAKERFEFGIRSFWFAILFFIASFVNLSELAAQQDDKLLQLQEGAIVKATQKVSPSIVQIQAFGGLEAVGEVVVGTAPTTGIVVSPDGYLLSSLFSFVQMPSSITVTLPDGQMKVAKIVARDHARMLILLKVEVEEPLLVPEFVDRNELQVGQTVIALGKTFSPKTANLSVGILSAKERIYGKAIQTDAKISPVNYGGPLIDLYGRVTGVLVPLSPQPAGAVEGVAGAQWYDSGIGFAVPVTDILPHLEKMKKGEDLYPGKIGLNLKGKNLYVDTAEVTSVIPNSPAAKAGFKPKDKIIRAGGITIERQAQFHHVLGKLYGGETLELTYLREGKESQVTVTLAEKLLPYRFPFLGVLAGNEPTDQSESGLQIRYLFPDSPAEKAGLAAEDRIHTIAKEPVNSWDEAIAILATHSVGEKVTIEVATKGERSVKEVTLASLPTTIKTEIPPWSFEATDLPEVEKEIETGFLEAKLGDEKNGAFLYVPKNYHPAVSHGLIVHLLSPADRHESATLTPEKLLEKRRALSKKWRPYCEERNWILLAIEPTDHRGWGPTEGDVIQKIVQRQLGRYTIDPARTLLYGEGASGAMAYMTGFAQRSWCRGIIAIEAELPMSRAVLQNDPIERLAIYYGAHKKTEETASVLAGLAKQFFPITEKEFSRQKRGNEKVTDAEFDEIAQWIDALGRF